MVFSTSTLLTSNCYSAPQDPRSLIGIHTMEAPEHSDTAEIIAQYFQNPAVQASAHWCVDNNSRVRCVRDEDGAWALPPTNHYSLNIEQAGYASQTSAEWGDAYSLAVLEISANCAAEWCKKYDIPVRRLTYAQIAAKEKGIAGHADVNAVFHASDHTDPGVNFPWSKFLARVAVLVGSPVIFPPKPPTTPNCVMLQKYVHTTADNLWGSDTDKHCTALIEASDWGGNDFPYGIAFLQEVVGTTQDGILGPKTWAAHTLTVMRVQNALHGMGFSPGDADGTWGPRTNNAYLAARAACHI